MEECLTYPLTTPPSTESIPEEVWSGDRQQLARASLAKWQGTPHIDRLAVVGVGVDCINLVYEVLIDARVLERRPFQGYDLRDGLHRTSDRLVRVMQHVTFCDVLLEDTSPLFGDVIIFKTGNRSGHCAFYADGDVWHSLSRYFVMHHPFDGWRKEIQAVCRLRRCGLRNPPQSAVKMK